jgi:hypothetical protein
VIGVERLLERLPLPLDPVRLRVESAHADLVAVSVEVELAPREPVDLRHPVTLQVSEHVVERAVLHHHHDDVLEPPQA